MIVGAEKVLCRVVDQKVSKMYNPVFMGEILALRAFTKTDDLHKIARTIARQEQKVGLDFSHMNDVSFKAKSVFLDPRSQWAILDGIEAVKWLYVLADYIHEPQFALLEAHFATLVRKYPNALDQVKSKWDATLWTIAIGMRDGESSMFHMIQEVLKDFSFQLKQDRIINQAEEAGSEMHRTRNASSDGFGRQPRRQRRSSPPPSSSGNRYHSQKGPSQQAFSSDSVLFDGGLFGIGSQEFVSISLRQPYVLL